MLEDPEPGWRATRELTGGAERASERPRTESRSAIRKRSRLPQMKGKVERAPASDGPGIYYPWRTLAEGRRPSQEGSRLYAVQQGRASPTPTWTPSTSAPRGRINWRSRPPAPTPPSIPATPSARSLPSPTPPSPSSPRSRNRNRSPSPSPSNAPPASTAPSRPAERNPKSSTAPSPLPAPPGGRECRAGVIRGIVRRDGTIDNRDIKDLPYGLGEEARSAVNAGGSGRRLLAGAD